MARGVEEPLETVAERVTRVGLGRAGGQGRGKPTWAEQKTTTGEPMG